MGTHQRSGAVAVSASRGDSARDASREGKGAWPERAGPGTCERVEAVAEAGMRREWGERLARFMGVGVAQQSVAPEPPQRDSYGYW